MPSFKEVFVDEMTKTWFAEIRALVHQQPSAQLLHQIADITRALPKREHWEAVHQFIQSQWRTTRWWTWFAHHPDQWFKALYHNLHPPPIEREAYFLGIEVLMTEEHAQFTYLTTNPNFNMTYGRSMTNNIRLRNATIGRRHGKLQRLENGNIRVDDHWSNNGTIVIDYPSKTNERRVDHHIITPETAQNTAWYIGNVLMRAVLTQSLDANTYIKLQSQAPVKYQSFITTM